MDLSFFIRGLLIGLSIAATVGPMSFLCIQRTLNRGQLYGFVSGLGIATADGVYGSIAAFGLTLLTHFLVSEQIWIRLIGGRFSSTWVSGPFSPNQPSEQQCSKPKPMAT